MSSKMWLLHIVFACFTTLAAAGGAALPGKSCKSSADCDGLLICANDFDPRFTKAKNKTCSIAIGSGEVKIGRTITKAYIKIYLEKIQTKLTTTMHAQGMALMNGTEIDYLVPNSPEAQKARFDSHLQNVFSTKCMSHFQAIIKETIRTRLNQFYLDTRGLTNQAQIKSKKGQFVTQMMDAANQIMAKHFEKEFTLFVKQNAEETKRLENEVVKRSGKTHEELKNSKSTFDRVFDQAEETFKSTPETGFAPFDIFMKLIDKFHLFVVRTIRSIVVIVRKGFVAIAAFYTTIVMNIKDGLANFVKAISQGNILVAFGELGLIWVKNARAGLVLAGKLAGVVWELAGLVGDMVLKVWKFLKSIRKEQWIALACGILFGALLATGVGAVVGSFAATAAWAGWAGVATEIVAGGFFSHYLEPMIEKKLFSHFNPDSLLLEDGQVVTKNPKYNNRYCSVVTDEEPPEGGVKEGVFCLNDKRDTCYMPANADELETCTDKDGKTHIIEDGMKILYNHETGEREPWREFNKTRQQDCRRDQSKQLICMDKTLGYECLVEDDKSKDFLCFDKEQTPIYFYANGTKSFSEFFDHERQEFCKMNQGKKICVNSELKVTCEIEEGYHDWCYDDKVGYLLVDGQKHYYDPETDTYNPPLKEDGTGDSGSADSGSSDLWEFDDARGESCTVNEDMVKICYNEKQDIYCEIKEDGTTGGCYNANGEWI